MTESRQFALPFVQAAQAQKHLTVNEAFARLDALAMLRLEAVGLDTPPAAPEDGSAWGVGAAPAGLWAGQAGRVAIFDNGGWVFADPRAGWRGWLVSVGAEVLHDGAGWVSGALALSSGRAATRLRIAETDHEIGAEPDSTTTALIPAGAQVIGVTGRILAEVAGTLSAFDLGVAGAEDRYGNGLGLAAGSFIRGLSGTPVTYYSPTALVLTAQGGAFATGLIRLAVHMVELEPPALP